MNAITIGRWEKENTSMIDYGLKDRVAIITGANNLQGIGATTAGITEE